MGIQDIVTAIDKKGSFREVGYEEFAPEDQWAHEVAKDLKETKMRQLRKVFKQIKNIDKKIKGRGKDEPLNESIIFYILPQVAYAVGRELVTEEFYRLVKTIIGKDATTTKLKTVADYHRFTEFMTAVLAYSK